MMLTLDNCIKNKTYKIESMSLPSETLRRLEALGMMPGSKLQVLNIKRNGTLIVYVRGTRFAIGRGISQSITVCKLNVKEGAAL